ARTGQSRDHGGQALLGSQASARQSLTARRSRAVDRSRERHGWSIGVRVRPHRAPCGASLPVGRSVFESGRPETGVYPLTIRMKIEGDLEPWIAEASASLLASFAAGIAKSKAAVRAAITQPWSNGQTEGHVNKLKMVKRQMYGRAKVDLLEARLIGAA